MKVRKFTAALIAATLLFAAATTALAQSPTVPGAVYSQTWGADKAHSKIKEELTKAGVKDVPSTFWAAGSLTVLLEAGLIKPDATGNLAPDSKVGTGEGVAIFAKVLGLASKLDDDATAMAKARSAGLVDDTADGEMTRLGVAKILAKALGVEPKSSVTRSTFPFSDGFDELSAEERGILAALYELGVFRGYPDKTFRPGKSLTRAEIAILVDRILGAMAP
ncbi:MAG: S-layer homology domain-containing protein [Bacillota bacterium]